MIAGVAVVVPAGLAWACVGLVSFTVSSANLQAGGTVTVTGREFAQGVPIGIHLDSPTGPLLATVPAPTTTMTSQWTWDVTIPPNTPNGQHLLVATQEYHNMNAGVPARALIYVGTPAVGPAPPVARPRVVATSTGPSALSLVVIGLGVAAGGLLLAGAWNVMAARPPRPDAEAVRAS